MAGLESFDKQLRLATTDLEPAAINAALAKFARQELAKAISAGASPNYDKFVNHRHGVPEETVQAPGPIIYVFNNWPLVINAALEELRRRGPRARSGLFASSFIVIVGGRLVNDFKSIPAEAEVIIVNATPYSRKAEVGRLGIPRRRLFDGTKNALSRRFRDAFRFETQFLNIGPGVHPMIPYRLKHGRRGRGAGQPMTYPALVINAAI